jgi:nucleoside-triphosphatase THEP1
MKKNILITGHPGCGKTTLVEKVVNGIKIPVTGFVTREIRERGRRVGFSLETLEGKRATLSHVDIQSKVRVGKYGVDLQALENIAVPSLHPGSADIVVVIDEIGKMECFSPLFRRAVLSVLDSSNPVFASIAEKGGPFIRSIKDRRDVELFRVLTVNRDSLAVSIIDRIRDLS